MCIHKFIYLSDYVRRCTPGHHSVYKGDCKVILSISHMDMGWIVVESKHGNQDSINNIDYWHK